MTFLDSANIEVWLEMHKLPKDQLLKELEAASIKDGNKETTLSVHVSRIM